jgi:hypothetical protein
MFEAFTILNSSRGAGMGGISPIPIQALIAYLDEFGITGQDERIRFILVMREVDSKFVGLINQKQKAEAERQRVAQKQQRAQRPARPRR